MNAAGIQASLYALRAQVDALITLVDGEMPAQENECPHPYPQRRDLSVIGGPERWLCQLCGHEEVVPNE